MKILISYDFLEHLLNCMANQKFNPNKEDQIIIDTAYDKGILILRDEKNKLFKKLRVKIKC